MNDFDLTNPCGTKAPLARPAVPLKSVGIEVSTMEIKKISLLALALTFITGSSAFANCGDCSIGSQSLNLGYSAMPLSSGYGSGYGYGNGSGYGSGLAYGAGYASGYNAIPGYGAGYGTDYGYGYGRRGLRNFLGFGGGRYRGGFGRSGAFDGYGRYDNGYDGARVLSSAAIAAGTNPCGPCGVPVASRRGRTFFDLQVLFIPLLRFGGRRKVVCAPAPQISQMVQSSPVVIAAPMIEKKVCEQRAVVPPANKTINLKDVETTTTTTKLWRR